MTARHIYMCKQSITSMSILLEAKGTKICGSKVEDAENGGHSNTYISTKKELQNINERGPCV